MQVTVTQIGNHQLKDSQGAVVFENADHAAVVAECQNQPEGAYTIETANESVSIVADPPPPPPPPPPQNALAAACAALSPGQAVEFTHASLNTKINGLRPTEGRADGCAFDWTVKGGWDSVTQRFMVACQPSGLYPNESIIMTYDAAADNWFAVREPWAGIGFGHGYDGNTFDPTARCLIKNDHALSNTNRLRRWNVDTWAPDTAMTPAQNLGFTWNTDCAVCYVPWGEQGGLIYVGNKNGGGGRAARWDRATDTWSLVWSGASFASNECVCHYNPTADRVVFGFVNPGGVLRILDSAGNVTDSAVAPTYVNAGSPGNYVFVPHPSGVESLVFSGTAYNSHEFRINPLTGVWTDNGARTWGVGSAHDVGVSIPEHNAILIVRYDYGNSKAYLYRPA